MNSPKLFVQFHREVNIFLDFFFFNISPILAEQKHHKIGRVKSHLGTPCGFISSTPSERATFLLQITAITFLGYVKFENLECQTKVTQRSNYADPYHAFTFTFTFTCYLVGKIIRYHTNRKNK